MSSVSVSAQPACLRCRSRKTKCLGRTDEQACQSCVSAGTECEVVPHQRGRKVGTKLSDSVRARLKRKRKRAKVSPDEMDESVVEGKTKGPVDVSTSSLDVIQARTRAKNQQHYDTYTSGEDTGYQIKPYIHPTPTSSVRISQNPDYNHTDIGPSIRRTSSISRIFSEEKRDVGKTGNGSGNGFSLWREDPITCGYIDEGTARELFELFMDKIAPNVYIFDQELHTYDYVQRTSSFLFCVILAIAAKFSPRIGSYTHKKCLALAKDQILRVFADDIKSEQTVQALFVLTEYKEAEDENAFLLLGMSQSRMAVDLDLSSPRPDYDERHNRDRQRIWLALYAADKRFNYCGQTAKPSMMPEDHLIRSSESFIYSPICIAVDYRLASNVALRRVLAVSIEAIDKDNESGPGNYGLNLRSVYHTFENDSEAWVKVQTQRDPNLTIHANLTAMHAKVIIAHRWVQRSFRNSNPTADPIVEDNQERERREALAACINGSLGILATMCVVNDDSIKYAPDSKHLYFAYASFFLYKVFDTKIATTVLDPHSLSYIFGLFKKAAEKLERLTISPNLTIAFHAAFLRRLDRFNSETNHSSSDHTNPHVEAPTSREVDQNQNQVQPQPQLQSEMTLSQNGLSVNEIPHSQNHQTLIQPTLDPTLTFPATSDPVPFPDLGNWLLESTDESLGANIDWNDWWPFDDTSWNFGNIINTDDTGVANGNGAANRSCVDDWQGVIQTL
ncbi:hypothetical protein I302_103019 [Kwoniella bestiolae CBS 10118]|uniref:Zn(2)-C6 fungal-type domain-containing protein n=1 Tax=Kwoniella bestiolae CBS 10118 TaxID=1296100 RepID=A0A1B9GGQ0_9TREE|nr:hypothetical protein I302_01715 [Kwoniella bestiolae CBS 10118]OCF30196.1 hypothetical protein I302_01715 [Kwoniella bestiolae CBS 10118]